MVRTCFESPLYGGNIDLFSHNNCLGRQEFDLVDGVLVCDYKSDFRRQIQPLLVSQYFQGIPEESASNYTLCSVKLNHHQHQRPSEWIQDVSISLTLSR